MRAKLHILVCMQLVAPREAALLLLPPGARPSPAGTRVPDAGRRRRSPRRPGRLRSPRRGARGPRGVRDPTPPRALHDAGAPRDAGGLAGPRVWRVHGSSRALARLHPARQRRRRAELHSRPPLRDARSLARPDRFSARHRGRDRPPGRLRGAAPRHAARRARLCAAPQRRELGVDASLALPRPLRTVLETGLS